MYQRTAQANKAITLAWGREQKLVSEGKGTRDWTIQQQQDILEKGKAYDGNGKAFEGQHMMSVESYPAFQGDPENIQFLTRDEHLAAHDGSWLNPTHWYYDPVTKEKTIFDSDKYVPCKIIKLCKPIKIPKNIEIESDTNQDAQLKKLDKGGESKSKSENEKRDNSKTIDFDATMEERWKTYIVEKNRREEERRKRRDQNFFLRIWDHHLNPSLTRFGRKVLSAIADPDSYLNIAVREVAEVGLERLYEASIEAREERMMHEREDHSDSSTVSTTTENDSVPDTSIIPSENDSEKDERKSPEQHDVREYDRTRYGKIEHVRGHVSPKNKDVEE